MNKNLTTQTVWADEQVAAVTNDDVLEKGSGHGSHSQQINWAKPKLNSDYSYRSL